MVISLFRRCVLLLACLFFVIPAHAETPQTLRLTTAYMDRHPAYLNVFEPWMRNLEKENSSLALQYYNPNTICPESGMLDAVEAGVVDIAANAHGRTPGRFPGMSVMDLPMLVSNAEEGSVISQALYDAHPTLQAEAANVRMLWHYVSSPHVLHTKKPVTKLEDLKGMKIVVWAPLAVELMRALGANPIQSVPHESYLAVQRGMADGVLCPVTTLRSFKISEALGHTTTLPLMVDSFWVGMNHKRWESLSPSQRDTIAATLPDMPRRTGRAQDEGAAAESSILAQQGHQFHTVDPMEEARWQNAMRPIYDRWLKNASLASAKLLPKVQGMLESGGLPPLSRKGHDAP